MALAGVLLLTAACSPDPATGASPTAAAPVSPRPAPVENQRRLEDLGVPLWDGQGDFYAPPEPLPPGQPGELIRVVPVSTPADDRAATALVMYHSRSVDGGDVAVTGTISIPHGDAPPGGRLVVSYAHGTSGLAAACAPSRQPEPPTRYLDEGYVLAATDYLGLGPPGRRHPYLSGVTEGRAVIDIARAARQLAPDLVGYSWFALGLSQGGHAALFAGEEAVDYAPELRLLGTVAIAPASGLDDLAPYAESGLRGYAVMIVFGLAVDYPVVRPDELLTDEALARAGVVDTGCSEDIANAYFAPPAEGTSILRGDPMADEGVSAVLEANNPGRRPTAAPVLIVHGTNDWVIPVERSSALVEDACAAGQTVQFIIYPDADHTTVLEQGLPDIDVWMTARLAGEPAPSSCPGTGAARGMAPG